MGDQNESWGTVYGCVQTGSDSEAKISGSVAQTARELGISEKDYIDR